MERIAAHLSETIAKAMPLLEDITDTGAGIRPAPGKWSPKEIIGHLIDSACNNHQKFVRAMTEDGLQFTGYEQDDWVAFQHYNDARWDDLLKFWQMYNRHIAHIMVHIPERCLSHTISIGDSRPFTLEFIVKDYPEHLKHHLKAILPDAGFLGNNFKMVY